MGEYNFIDDRIPLLVSELYRLECERKGASRIMSLDPLSPDFPAPELTLRLVNEACRLLAVLDDFQHDRTRKKPKRELSPDELWETIVSVSKP